MFLALQPPCQTRSTLVGRVEVLQSLNGFYIGKALFSRLKRLFADNLKSPNALAAYSLTIRPRSILPSRSSQNFYSFIIVRGRAKIPHARVRLPPLEDPVRLFFASGNILVCIQLPPRPERGLMMPVAFCRRVFGDEIPREISTAVDSPTPGHGNAVYFVVACAHRAIARALLLSFFVGTGRLCLAPYTVVRRLQYGLVLAGRLFSCTAFSAH